MRKLVLTPIAILAASLTMPGAAALAADPPPERIAPQRLVCISATPEIIARAGAKVDTAVLCRWTKSTSTAFGSYKLGRRSETLPRTLAFATTDANRTWFLDTRVRKGATYTYRVATFAGDGSMLAVSQPVSVTA